MQPISNPQPSPSDVPAQPPREPFDAVADAARESGLPPEQLRRHLAHVDAQEAANAKPAPGPLLDAFLPTTITALGLKLRPVVATDFLLLQKIDSPLARHIRELAKAEAERTEPDYSAEDIIDLIFLFTRPVAVARESAANFREAALRSIGDQLPPAALSEMQDALLAIATNIARALSTHLAHQGASPGDGSVFTPPPAAPKTASAGG